MTGRAGLLDACKDGSGFRIGVLGCLDACEDGSGFRTGVLGCFDACGDGSGFGTGVLSRVWLVFLTGSGCAIAAAVGKMDPNRPGLTLGAIIITPRPIPGRRLGTVTGE